MVAITFSAYSVNTWEEPVIAAITQLASRLDVSAARSQLCKHSALVNGLLKSLCSIELPLMTFNRLGRLSIFFIREKRETRIAEPKRWSSSLRFIEAIAASGKASNAIPVLLGISAFLAIVGRRVLYPTNIAWLGYGDPATYYLGWLSFRTSDWSFPIGLNPRYGLELGNSIVYSDSNPLLALLFKPFDALLPDPFQYFGFWLLLCFLLQAWFAWKLVGLIDANIFVRIFGTTLFLFAPPMLWRLHNFNGHLNLAGHFLILAGLYLCLKPTNNRRLGTWGALLIVAVLVNAYLLLMVIILWLADVFWRIVHKEQSIVDSAVEIGVVASLLAAVAWQIGYFSVHGASLAARGFGHFRMNLLSPLDPVTAASTHWSYIFRDIPEATGDYEGFNFLGLGVIFLAILCIPGLLKRDVEFSKLVLYRPILLIALLGMTTFAISPHIGIGALNFRYYELQGKALAMAETFRSSGRLFWPVFYTILLTAVFIVVRGYGTRIGTILLVVAVILQVADTSQAWCAIRTQLMTPRAVHWPTPLKSPFWSQAALRYSYLRVIPPKNHPPNWQVFAYYAGIHGMGTNSIYLARVSKRPLMDARARAYEMLRTGVFMRDTLYILDRGAADKIAPLIDANTDLLAEIDGFNVLAPGWNCRGLNCLKPAPPGS